MLWTCDSSRELDTEVLDIKGRTVTEGVGGVRAFLDTSARRFPEQEEFQKNRVRLYEEGQ
jgi:hypothetical protein